MCCTFLIRRFDGTTATILAEDDGSIGENRWRTRMVIEGNIHVFETCATSAAERIAEDGKLLAAMGFDPSTLDRAESVPCPLSL